MKIHYGILILTTLFSSGFVQADEVLGLMPGGSATPATNAPAQPAVSMPANPPRQQPALQFPPQAGSSQQAAASRPAYYYQQQPAYGNYYPTYPNYYAYPRTNYYYPYAQQAYRAPYPYAMQARPMPPVPPKKKETKPWGDTRYIWPDFYTDFTGDFWDKMINAPSDMGYMPGGWRFPSFSSPDPVTVSDAIANQVPPFAEEAGKMVPLDDVGNVSPLHF